jgi:hypothetical protein
MSDAFRPTPLGRVSLAELLELAAAIGLLVSLLWHLGCLGWAMALLGMVVIAIVERDLLMCVVGGLGFAILLLVAGTPLAEALSAAGRSGPGIGNYLHSVVSHASAELILINVVVMRRLGAQPHARAGGMTLADLFELLAGLGLLLALVLQLGWFGWLMGLAGVTVVVSMTGNKPTWPMRCLIYGMLFLLLLPNMTNAWGDAITSHRFLVAAGLCGIVEAALVAVAIRRRTTMPRVIKTWRIELLAAQRAEERKP